MATVKKRTALIRRDGALGVHSLDHFAFAAPDLKVAETFYKAFGLDVRNENGGLGLYTSNHPHRWGFVAEGAKKRLHHISFGLYEDDLPSFSRRLQRFSVRRVDPPRGMESNGIWFHDHEGSLVEVRVADKVSPSSKPVVKPTPVAPGKGASPKRSQAGRTWPQRLSHVLLFTSSVDGAIDFYSRTLGLRLSDRSGSNIAFMHAPHGSDHHVVAFARSEGPGMHHCSWAVRSVHEIGLGAERMAEQGYGAGWGVGRHVLGSNYFYYVRDPWGGYSEYSYDIDFVPVDVNWKAADHDGEDAFYVWGPKPPADFVVNYELR